MVVCGEVLEQRDAGNSRKRTVLSTRVPDAVQRGAKRNGAPLIRDRSKAASRNGPGSAAHHYVLRRARDTSCNIPPRVAEAAKSPLP